MILILITHVTQQTLTSILTRREGWTDVELIKLIPRNLSSHRY